MGDGTQPVTMRVFADQAGTLTLGLEAGGPTIQLSETVEAGWNNVVFACPRLLVLVIARR